MAVSAERFRVLCEEFKPVKQRIADIDRKYSLTYVEPDLDIPESLGLPLLEFTPKTEQELLSAATEQTEASHLAALSRLDSGKAAKLASVDRQISDLEEQTRTKLAGMLSSLNKETDAINKRIVNAGMIFSTTAERLKAKLRYDYEKQAEECNQSAANDLQTLTSRREQINSDYDESVASLNSQRQAKLNVAYDKLVKSDRAEQTRVDKYNNAVSEKETKYKLTRARALEAIKQAEYNRSFAAKKLYQQMGATGYEEAMLWEKYNVFIAHFSSFTVREEALVLIQTDSYVRGHLKQYYSTLLEWVNLNIQS